MFSTTPAICVGGVKCPDVVPKEQPAASIVMSFKMLNRCHFVFCAMILPCAALADVNVTVDAASFRSTVADTAFGIHTSVYDKQHGNAGWWRSVDNATFKARLLEQMRAVQRTRLIALDATWYFSSQSKNICCSNCSCLQHAEGQTTHFHSAITPVIVSPGHSQVVPLRPEFITPQDGQSKQDCEIAAAKRWLAAHAQRYSTGNDTLLGDDLYAHQPFCRQVFCRTGTSRAKKGRI